MLQYSQYLKESSIECSFSSFLNSKDYLSIYNKKDAGVLRKSKAMIHGTSHQLKTAFNTDSYDAVVVYREAMLWGGPWIERHFVKKGIPVIFDFDDAVWLAVRSEIGINPYIKRLLKTEKKYDKIMKSSTHVIAGNEYLAQHARKLNRKVTVIPTVVDTEFYKPTAGKPDKNKTVIGWIGSGSTSEYLRLLDNVWRRLPGNCEVRFIGGRYGTAAMEARTIPWSLDTEIKELEAFDVGIMPLPNDEWSKGKCGLKALQYMAMGIPCVASPVGVNTEIIQDGVNGMLAKDEKEWIEKLSLLLEDPALRERLGRAGRKTVEERYSVKAWAPVYLDTINHDAAS